VTKATSLPPQCSFIVSTFQRSSSLHVVLASLAEQREARFEVIVADNSVGREHVQGTRTVVHEFNKPFFKYLRCNKASWCLASNQAASQATGEYLCFPSDDSYYPPDWLIQMLRVNTDLILSNAWVETLGSGWYHFWEQKPTIGRTLKEGFLIRRSLFPGFFHGEQSHAIADALLLEKIAARKDVSIGVLPSGIFFVQNS
jgi:hypothetical protein